MLITLSSEATEEYGGFFDFVIFDCKSYPVILGP